MKKSLFKGYIYNSSVYSAIKFYSESELELSISIEDFLDFFFIDSKKSLTRTLGGTMSEEKKQLNQNNDSFSFVKRLSNPID